MVALGSVFILSVAVLAQTPSIPAGPTVSVFEGEYHVAACPRLAGQAPKSMSLAEAMRAGAGPCRVCEPNRNDQQVQSFAANYAVAISRETAPIRAAAAAERSRVAGEVAAERARVAAEERKLAAEAAAAERKRREAEPLVRVTAAQAGSILNDAAKGPRNNKSRVLTSTSSGGSCSSGPAESRADGRRAWPSGHWRSSCPSCTPGSRGVPSRAVRSRSASC